MIRSAVIPLFALLTWPLPVLRAQETVEPGRFEKELVVAGCNDPVQLDFAPDGKLYWLERPGAVKVHDPLTKSVALVASLNSTTKSDGGALGMVLGRDFGTTGHIFALHMPRDSGDIRVSRFTVKEQRMVDGSLKDLLVIPLEKNADPYHCGGGLCLDTSGNLLIGIGDNSPPQDLPAIHPVEHHRDSRRTAGNSMELRGKILRIRPAADGTYTIPEGNLFTDPAKGRPEVYAMGVRNPFRIAADPGTGMIAFGDVGGNVNEDFQLGPGGYDEINVTREPGFFGWPWCSGPGKPWRPFDPKTSKPAGEFFDPAGIVNDSAVNTGLRELPPARHSVFHYGSLPSAEWPFAGSGGRSITGGTFYRSAGFQSSPVRLPDAWDGTYFIAEWMRNWLGVLRFTPQATLASAEAFPATFSWLRPAYLTIGPEGALYVAEHGGMWAGNLDSRITRVIYRRGNRAPQARAVADATAGALPLTVKFSATGSTDPDKGDALKYTWDFGDGQKAEGAEAAHTFTAAGAVRAVLTVTDTAGAAAIADVLVMAGNAAPQVAFRAPANGSFFEYGKPVAWELAGSDKEDGPLAAERVLVQVERRDHAAEQDESLAWPGLAIMRRTTCFACHNATSASAGPPYSEVAKRYAAQLDARGKLAQKILSGGTGVWGQAVMPPHPQHTAAEAAQMVDWILSLATRKVETLPAGLSGSASVHPPANVWGVHSNGVMILTAAATDLGAAGLPAQRSTARVALRTRRQRAAFFDHADRAFAQDNLDQGGLVARIPDKGSITFDPVNLAQTRRVRITAWPQSAPDAAGAAGGMQAWLSTGTARAAAVNLEPGPPTGRGRQIELPLPDGATGSSPVSLHFTGSGILDVMWVEFLPE